MKIFTLILIFLLKINVNQNYSQEFPYWENLNSLQKNNFIITHEISDLAMRYYKGELKIDDDKETYDLLDVLVTTDTALIPFYYYLFNEVCLDADGAISDVIGQYCLKMITDNPDYVINHFTYDRENKRKKLFYYQIYGDFIGYEMYFKEKGVSDIDYSFEQFKEYLNNSFRNGTEENRNTLQLLYDCISNTMKDMTE